MTRRRTAAAAAVLAGAALVAWGLIAPAANASYATSLAAEPGQRPMPTHLSPVADKPENCKGIAPTAGSGRARTTKQLNDGQGLVKPAPNVFAPGGVVHWVVSYGASNSAKRFEIRDCVVEFLPSNPSRLAVLALMAAGTHSEVVAVPGSTPALKSFDHVLDSGQFEFPSRVALPGEFDMSWTVSSKVVPGALVCNYAKDTGGNATGGTENRKAGAACFVVPQTTPTTTTGPTTTTRPTTTSTVTPSTVPGGTTTTTASVATTTTTASVTTTAATSTSVTTVARTTTTAGPSVLGEQTGRLPLTGGAGRVGVIAVGLMLMAVGSLVLAIERRR